MTTVFRRFRRLDVLVACLTLVACIFVSEVWLPSFVRRSLVVHRLLAQPRDLVMLIYISHPGYGFRSESWAFHDADGLSRVRYTVVGPRGDASVTEPPSGRVDVPALFDAAKSYGLLGPSLYGQGESHIYLAARVGKHWERHDVYFPTAELYAMRKREYHLDLARESPQSAPPHSYVWKVSRIRIKP